MSSYTSVAEAAEKPPLALRVANVAAYALCLASNGWAGSKIGGVSRKYPNAIVPDGWAFGIWGIIYTLLTAFIVYQAVCRTPAATAIVNSIGWLWVASCACNALWIVLFVQATPLFVCLSCPVLFGLLAVNIGILYKAEAWQPDNGHGALDRLVVALPFSIYSGWTTVASIVNVACAGVALQWDGHPLTPSAWSAVLICVAAVINLLVLARRGDPVYPLVFVWASAAIHTGHKSDELVATTALVAAVVVAAVEVVVGGLMLSGRREMMPLGYFGRAEAGQLLPVKQ